MFIELTDAEVEHIKASLFCLGETAFRYAHYDEANKGKDSERMFYRAVLEARHRRDNPPRPLSLQEMT